MTTLDSSLVPAAQRADEFRATFDVVAVPLLVAAEAGAGTNLIAIVVRRRRLIVVVSQPRSPCQRGESLALASSRHSRGEVVSRAA